MTIRIKKTKFDISSLSDLFSFLSKSRPKDRYINVYRGHPNKAYSLTPSLFRKSEHRRDEKFIFRELITIQPREFRDDQSVFEQLVRMQHYSLPTRLLDITYNPLVGLYFACNGGDEKGKDGELLQFSIHKSKVKYFDSDTVACVANLANLTARQRNQIRAMKTDADLNKDEVGERLLHFIKAEKPYFLPKIALSDLRSILPVKPKQTNQRILAQQGAFLIFGFKSELTDENDFGIKISRATIPAIAKQDILSELDAININASSLFPEIESAAKYIMSKIVPTDEQLEASD